MQQWDRESIVAEIKRLNADGANLDSSEIAKAQPELARASTRFFGSWQAAVEAAGLKYTGVRRYRAWTRDAIIERIQQLNEDKVDISWRHISTQVDPQLAAAATKTKHFGSWRAAVEAAGLDYDAIRRYRKWSDQAIIDGIRKLHEEGKDLNAKAIEELDITLITAARRRFDSWHKALESAGLDHKTIVLRKPFKRKKKAKAA